MSGSLPSPSEDAVRVLHLSDNLRVGGLQRILVTLANLSATRGFSVFVAAGNEGRLWDAVSPNCTKVSAPSKPSSLRQKVAYAAWLRRTIRKNEIQIIHAHQRGVSFLARVASLGSKCRVVEHVHSTFLPISSRLTSFRAHELIGCGPAIAQMLKEDYKRNPARITCINNAVHDGTHRGRMPLPSTTSMETHIVCVGRLTDQKNPLKFVQVIHELSRLRGPESIRATWVGGGELLSEAQKLANSLGAENIHFAGDQVDVEQWIQRADVLLLTSRWEGLPLVVLEAMSMGRGIIAPDVGSCGEAVVDGTNGVLFDSTTMPEQLAKELSPQLVAENLVAWGKASREIYEDLFTPTRMVSEVESVYERVLRRHTIDSPFKFRRRISAVRPFIDNSASN